MAEDNKLRVRLVTPDRVLLHGVADAVELPSKSGYMEVLYGHAPLLALLGAGDVTLHGGDVDNKRYNVSWGFVEVLPDRVTILANDALEPKEIDVPRAQEQMKHGEQLWNEAGDSEEKYAHANEVIIEAEAKLTSAGNPSH
jgi:F-type H+-transporting ATPase subunit epsilon